MGRKRRLKGSLAISLRAVDKDPPNFDSWVFKRADAYMNSFLMGKSLYSDCLPCMWTYTDEKIIATICTAPRVNCLVLEPTQ